MDEKDKYDMILLAGTSTQETPWIPAGAFIYRTLSGSTIAFCYGPEQDKGLANINARKILEVLTA